MEKTRDYGIFKKMTGNRELDANNLRKVVNSIKLSNLLEHRPLLVNEKMEVIDGQHRLEAARILGLEVFYTIDKTSVAADMHLLNSAQKTWTLDDYLNFHAARGNREHVKMKQFCDRMGINCIDLLTLSGCRTTGTVKLKIGEPIFQDTDKMFADLSNKLDFIANVCSFIDEMVIGDKSYLESKLMKRALGSLVNCDGFDRDIFMAKLKMNLTRLRICRSGPEYLDMFKGFYNYRNSDPLP